MRNKKSYKIQVHDIGLLRQISKVKSLKDDMDTLYDGMAACLAKAKKLAGKKKSIPNEFLYCKSYPDSI